MLMQLNKVTLGNKHCNWNNSFYFIEKKSVPNDLDYFLTREKKLGVYIKSRNLRNFLLAGANWLSIDIDFSTTGLCTENHPLS